MHFIKQYLYVIIGVLCLIALGAAYFYARYKPSAVLGAGTSTVIISDSAIDSDETADDPKNATAADKTEDRLIKVYITGAVEQPGVYEVSENARVDDVLKLAGGAAEDADLRRINLAAHVKDAQQITVPAIGEADIDPLYSETESNAASDASETNVSGLININTADAAALQTLPGIGQVIAGNIIAYRQENGNFKSIEDITKVSRIGDATFEKIKGMITVD